MRPVYATRFKLENRSDHGTPPFDEVRDRIAGWVEKKYKTFHRVDLSLDYSGSPQHPVDGYEISATDERHGDGRLVEVNLSEQDDQGRLWRTSVMLASDGSAVEFSTVVRIGSAQFAVQPLGKISTGPPRVVRDLVKRYVCRASEVEIASRHTLVTPDHVDTLVGFVLHPARALPIILVSQERDGRTVRSTEKIQQKLVGLAHVYEIDYDASYELTNSKLNKEGSCYEGAVRVYWPGYEPEAYLRHPLYLPGRIWAMADDGRPVEDVLFRRLSDIAATRYGDGPVLRTLRAAAARSRREEVEKLREAIREARENPQNADTEWLSEYAEKVSDQNEALAERVADLERQLDLKTAELATTKQNAFAIQQHQVQEGHADIQEAVEEVTPSPPGSVLEALSRAGRTMSDRLTIWDSATESASGSASAKGPEVLGALRAIADLAGRYSAEDGAVGPWRNYFEGHGLNYAQGESEMTMNMHGDERQFRHDGDSREMQKHITIAKNHPTNCVQIYFDVDEKTERFTIGYCGPHLQTYRSTF